jgi:tRNA pseudouridine55 synthase
VTRVRRVLGERRVGHTGTLDPFATGLLLVLVGRVTRLARFLTALDKQYTGVITLGAATETDDKTGPPIATSERYRDLSDADLAAAAAGLVGTYAQRPPAYSARKVGGQRAYRLARRGTPADLTPRDVRVHAFALGLRNGDSVPFRTTVSSGTYVRALARDLGDALGCGAHLRALRRTAIGPFDVADAVSLDALAEGTACLRAPRDAVRHLPAVAIDAARRADVLHGRPVQSDTGYGGAVALVADDELVAVAEPGRGGLQPRVVLAE